MPDNNLPVMVDKHTVSISQWLLMTKTIEKFAEKQMSYSI